MKHIYTYIIISLSLLAGCFRASAQEYVRPGSKHDNMIISVVSAYNSGNIEEASRIANEIVAEDPDNDAAWYYLAQCAVRVKDLALAEQCYRVASELDPGNFWYRYRLARLYSVTSRPELTMEMYERLLDDFPKKNDIYLDLVEIYVAQKEYEKALEVLKEIETVFGMTESIAMYRFNLLRVLNRPEEAYESLEKYNRQYSSPFVLTTLADYQMSMYNDSTAVAYYDEALDLAPDYFPAMLGKAETYRLTRKYDDYFSVLGKYVQSDDTPAAKSDYLMAVIQRTDPMFIRNFLPQIDSVVTKALESHPSDSTLLQTAAVYYYSTDRMDGAKKYFKENMKAWPKSFSARASYVEFLMYAEEWEELSSAGREAFELFPKETAFLEMASMGDYNLEAYDKVLEICEKVLEVAPADSSSNLRAWSTMGDIYHQLGDSKKAYKAYDKALKINPGYVYVLNNYAYYMTLEGWELQRALEMSHKTIVAEPENPTYIDTYAWALFALGRYEEAKAYIDKLFMIDEERDAVVYHHAGDIYARCGEMDRAVEFWQKAVEKGDESKLLKKKIKKRKYYKAR